MYGYSLGLAALGEGELYDAADRLQQAWDLAFRQGINNPNVFPMAGDLAEALARAGEFDRCKTDPEVAGRASPGDRIGIPPRSRLPGAGNPGNRTQEAQRLVSLNPSPHWTRSAQSRSNKPAPSCAPGGDAPRPSSRRRAYASSPGPRDLRGS